MGGRDRSLLAALAANTLGVLSPNTDAGMRIPSVIIASLALIWPCLSIAAFAQQSTGAGAENPLPQAEASPNDIDGEKMFATTCGFCHQDGGRHAGRGPKLSKSERSDEYIVERIKKGKPGAMPAYGGVFSDGQIIAILAYIRGLDD
ncbi:c-type cytochrome [Bradyrhizobium australiense]|nr:cytochrome c [Bradyrhizobium australiense]